MQYLYGEKPYSTVIEEYIAYFRRPFSVDGDVALPYMSMEAVRNKITTTDSDFDKLHLYGRMALNPRAQDFMINWFVKYEWNTYNINAVYTGYVYEKNKWCVNAYGVFKYDGVNITCKLVAGDNKLCMYGEEHSILNGVVPEWGEFSPHNIQKMMSIKTLQWKYTSDVKFVLN